MNLQELSVARYMDFCNLAPTGDYEKILAVVLIPDGKEYGDYDLDQVYNDILDMNMVDVYSIFNFFKYSSLSYFINTLLLPHLGLLKLHLL